MIIEKGQFHFAEKYWGQGSQGTPAASPCSDGFVQEKNIVYPLKKLTRLDLVQTMIKKFNRFNRNILIWNKERSGMQRRRD